MSGYRENALVPQPKLTFWEWCECHLFGNHTWAAKVDAGKRLEIARLCIRLGDHKYQRMDDRAWEGVGKTSCSRCHMIPEGLGVLDTILITAIELLSRQIVDERVKRQAEAEALSGAGLQL